jgi:hypothetical protein
MVIDGSSIRKTDLTYVKIESDRIYVPSHLVEKVGLEEAGKMGWWLLIVTPGRYRLIPKATADSDDDLSAILSQIERAGTRGGILDGTEDNEAPAIRARLIDCVVSPPPPGWRINLPKEAKQLVAEKEERTSVFVFTVAGYVELWFPDILSRAVSVPISDLLP